MIDPARCVLFIPAGLKKFKLDLFERIGRRMEALGGKVVRHDINELCRLVGNTDLIPIVGCQPESTIPISKWQDSGKDWIYWDRGYARRVFATWLPRGDNGGYYRWHLNAYQMQELREVPGDRWDALKTPVAPWQRDGDHIVIANGSHTYDRFHLTEGWLENTVRLVSRHTKRRLLVRDKETQRPLQDDLKGAHCLISHGSIAAVEAVILGCPVFVNSESAAALVGKTDLTEVEAPVYPDRTKWLHSLAYCQFDEAELVDGTLWRLIE